MKTIIKELLRRGDFVQAVAEEMGKELASRQIEDHWFTEDWNKEFYNTLRETVNGQVLESVNEYMKQCNIKKLIDSVVRSYLVRNISDILDGKNDKDIY